MKSGLRCIDSQGQGQGQGVRSTLQRNLEEYSAYSSLVFLTTTKAHLITLPVQKRKLKPKVGLALLSREAQVCLGPGFIRLPQRAFLLTPFFLWQGKQPPKVLQQTRAPVTSPRTSSNLGSARMPNFFSLSHSLPIPSRCSRTFPVSGSHSGIRQRLYRVALEWGPVF